MSVITSRPWTDLYPAGVDPAPKAPEISMLAAWERTVAAHEHDVAVHHFHHSMTFGQIDAAAHALAAGLGAEGVSAGDRIALYMQNDPQWLVSLVAAWRLGAFVACINPMLRGGELRKLVRDADARVLICLDSLYQDIVQGVRDELGGVTVVTTAPWDMAPEDVAPPASFAEAWGERRRFAETLDWLDLQTDHEGATVNAPNVTAEDIALLTYTSGTTGAAKGAMNLHGGMVHSAQVYVDWFDLRPERDVVLGIAPLFHITGSVAGLGVTILAGVPIVLLHRFDASETLLAIEHRHATFTVAASTAFNALSAHADVDIRDLASLTKTACGGAPLSTPLRERIRERTGWVLHGVYGLTETTSPVTLCPPGKPAPLDPDSGAMSVGVPVPGAELVVVDDVTAAPLEPGVVGEIAVSGPMVVPGYWRSPEESANAIREGRLLTGDVGYVDAGGWLFVVDRKKDLINAGGYKIWPRDVEEIVESHPAVREVAVVGIPDEYRGETVKAFVSLEPGADVSAEDIIAFTKERIAAYKYPRLVEIVADLPKNASGKILRRELRPVTDRSRR